MILSSTLLIVIIFIIIFLLIIGGIISYFSAKAVAKWCKNVQVIDKRKDLTKSPKLAEIQRMVKVICRHYQIPAPEIGIYPSREINAFATGRPNDGLIAFSTGLIDTMEIKEIKGVVAHEMAHLINYDLAKILLISGSIELLLMLFNFLLISWVFKRVTERSKEKGQVDWGALIFFYILYHIISAILRVIGMLFIFAFIRSRELKADQKGAEIVGADTMIATLRKLMSLEKKDWIVDGLDLSENDEAQLQQEQASEPTSIQVSKFNPQRKKNWLLDLFRTHPRLEERIKKLEKLKQKKGNF